MLTDNTSDNQTHNSIDLGTKGDYDRKFDKTENKVTVCSCHVTYAFESECTLYSSLNVKELLARSRREI